MKKEYDLNKLKRVKKGAIAGKSAKVSKTIRLDLEIVSWLVAEAEKRGLKYQTLINTILREVMLNNGRVMTEGQVREIVHEELRRKAI